ncbi:MAG: zinc-dependent metalloprotease [Acidimicrobiia bacterium]|nr:zinc-dependent metalloprotease [Acidimicrobiia bacterium]MCY4457538.1 zinc-dependent metalloprotease [Acidimicrobiaceae bacterium]
MSDDIPPAEEPLGAFFGEIMKALTGSGGSPANSGRDLARSIATDGKSEPNIDPSARLEIEELLRVAELQVGEATQLRVSSGAPLKVDVVNRTLWIEAMIDQFQPLLADIARTISTASVATALPETAEHEDNPMHQMFAGISQLLETMLSAMTTGSLVGTLAQVAFGGFHLPIPRPQKSPLLILLPNLDEFGKQWSLDVADLRLWVCLNETIHHTVLGIPHVAERINDLLKRHAKAFEYDATSVSDSFGDLDLDVGPEMLFALNERLTDPELIFGSARSPTQEALSLEITALLAAISGYVDQVMDKIGGKIIGSYSMITEAMRRRRVQTDASDRFVERILGFDLDQSQYTRGTTFAEGVVERAGPTGLDRLFDNPEHLPTPAEVDAPGLWLARIDLPD